jgi:hypothetical protein
MNDFVVVDAVGKKHSADFGVDLVSVFADVFPGFDLVGCYQDRGGIHYFDFVVADGVVGRFVVFSGLTLLPSVGVDDLLSFLSVSFVYDVPVGGVLFGEPENVVRGGVVSYSLLDLLNVPVRDTRVLAGLVVSVVFNHVERGFRVPVL